jgi:predicted acyl esterase
VCIFFLLGGAPDALAVLETHMVPMRDGVRLATDVYRPDDSLAHPVLLYRTPYWRFLDRDDPAHWNSKGYVFISQDVRGRFGSEGVDSVFLDDGWGAKQDGYDTIEWAVQQPWCDGKVGIFGSSARGITTYRAAGSLHPNLVCCVPIVACSDFFHQVVFPGGQFRKSLCENWLKVQGAEHMMPFFFSHPYYDTLWELMDMHTRTDSITSPMLHIGGWYDCFSEGIVEAFRDLTDQAQAGPQKLIMGPWVHGTVGSGSAVGELIYPDAAFGVRSMMDDWLDYWLLADSNGVLETPDVRYYLMGDPDKTTEEGCEWIEADVWPPESVVERPYFLADSARLSLEIEPGDDNATFSFDPRSPVPTVGGNNLMIAAGPYDQTAIGPREDVLEFSTGLLEAPLRVEGTVRGSFFVSSDRWDTDFTLKLIDVYPDGREMLVTDGVIRARYRHGDREEEVNFLTPGEVTSVTVELPPTAVVFNSGHRVKACISSSNYPRYEINPNTDDPPYGETDTLIASNTVYFGYSFPSAVILPVVEDSVITQEFPLRPDRGSSSLLANHPNPFRSRTVINYTLAEGGPVKLAIYDSAGRCVRVLFRGRETSGDHRKVWNARDDSGNLVSSGVYFCRLHLSPGLSKTAKALLVRH